MKVAADAEKLTAPGHRRRRFRRGRAGLSDAARTSTAAAHARDRRATSRSTRPTPAPRISKRAIVARYQTDYGVEYAADEVIVTAGGKQALFNSVLALFGPGDEVITHAPGWPTLVEQIKLAERDAGDRAHARRRTASR